MPKEGTTLVLVAAASLVKLIQRLMDNMDNVVTSGLLTYDHTLYFWLSGSQHLEDHLVGNPISEPISNVMTSLVETLISVGDTIWWHLHYAGCTVTLLTTTTERDTMMEEVAVDE